MERAKVGASAEAYSQKYLGIPPSFGPRVIAQFLPGEAGALRKTCSASGEEAKAKYLRACRHPQTVTNSPTAQAYLSGMGGMGV